MNLIEQLGGYENVSKHFNRIEYHAETKIFIGEWFGFYSMRDLKDALLEHRRQHNIFEVGDKVVFRECSGIGGASDAIDLMTVKSIDAFGVRMTNSLCPWAIQIRHATDEEIKAGKRLEVNQ